MRSYLGLLHLLKLSKQVGTSSERMLNCACWSVGLSHEWVLDCSLQEWFHHVEILPCRGFWGLSFKLFLSSLSLCEFCVWFLRS